MNKHEILKQLSSIECDLYYAIDEGNTEGIDLEALKTFHDEVDTLLNKWHDLTGETL